ncbi:hypothetical protein CW304_05810 [Bacillus sp. UFRGS-B20]|nr:hypothetical protein CW304_05810 [Bacillus sp. UFRGS-B20]
MNTFLFKSTGVHLHLIKDESCFALSTVKFHYIVLQLVKYLDLLLLASKNFGFAFADSALYESFPSSKINQITIKFVGGGIFEDFFSYFTEFFSPLV